MNSVNSQAYLVGMVIGAAVGAVAALLYAPVEGPVLTAWRDSSRPTTDDPRVRLLRVLDRPVERVADVHL